EVTAVVEEPVAEAVEEPAAVVEEPVAEAVEEPAAVVEEPVAEAVEEVTAVVEEPVAEAVDELAAAFEGPAAVDESVGADTPIEEFEDLATSAIDTREGSDSGDSNSSGGVDDFVLVNAGDASGLPAVETQAAPSISAIFEDVAPVSVNAGEIVEDTKAARSLSVPLKRISNDVQDAVDTVSEAEPLTRSDLVEDVDMTADTGAEAPSLSEVEVPAAVADIVQPPVESTVTADEPELSTAPSDTGFIIIKDRETTTVSPAADATLGDLLNIDTIRSFDEVDSVLYPSEVQASSAMHNTVESGDTPQAEVTVTTPSYVMHYPESLFGDANSITPGLITMDDLHMAQKASA
ncbi:hypothetical protein H4S07_006962, partial [Coemansia furcata]